MLTRMVLICRPRDPPALASQSAGIIGLSHRTWSFFFWDKVSLCHRGGSAVVQGLQGCTILPGSLKQNVVLVETKSKLLSLVSSSWAEAIYLWQPPKVLEFTGMSYCAQHEVFFTCVCVCVCVCVCEAIYITWAYIKYTYFRCIIRHLNVYTYKYILNVIYVFMFVYI